MHGVRASHPPTHRVLDLAASCVWCPSPIMQSMPMHPAASTGLPDTAARSLRPSTHLARRPASGMLLLPTHGLRRPRHARARRLVLRDVDAAVAAYKVGLRATHPSQKHGRGVKAHAQVRPFRFGQVARVHAHPCSMVPRGAGAQVWGCAEGAGLTVHSHTPLAHAPCPLQPFRQGAAPASATLYVSLPGRPDGLDTTSTMLPLWSCIRGSSKTASHQRTQAGARHAGIAAAAQGAACACLRVARVPS